jgi:MFS family permease
MKDHSRRLVALTALLLAGILAGTQLGKIAPLVPWFRDEVGFSLVLIGWLTSAIGVFVAIAAFPAGISIGRFGARSSFIGGSVVLALGGVLIAFAGTPVLILAARLIEGLGYLVLVVAIPALLNSISPPSWRAPALAVWGGFVPVGFAIADFLSLGVLPVVGPQLFLLIAIIAFALPAAVASPLVLGIADYDDAPADRREGLVAATLTLPVVLVALGFGIYVILSVGFFTFMPAYIGGAGAALLLPAGVVALLVPIGNALAGWLVRGRDAAFVAMLAGFGFAVTALAAVPAYSGAGAAPMTVAMVLVAISGGVIASALFADIPFILPENGSAAVAIGLVAQSGGIATVIGPPLAGYVIETHGWPGFGWFLVAVSAVGLALLVPLYGRRARARS